MYIKMAKRAPELDQVRRDNPQMHWAAAYGNMSERELARFDWRWLVGLSRRLAGWGGVVLLLWIMAGLGRASLVDFSDNFLAFAQQRWGRDVLPRLKQWQRLVRDQQAANAVSFSDDNGLALVNRFFNQVPFVSDLRNWGVEDYWATPSETLGSFGADCEDYSIAKYLSLKEIGVPVQKLRITYVRARQRAEPHMVLAYYPRPDADPLILDSLTGDIRPASQRPDLVPVYGFNDDDLWLPGGDGLPGGASNVRLWRELLEKLAKEQQM